MRKISIAFLLILSCNFALGQAQSDSKDRPASYKIEGIGSAQLWFFVTNERMDTIKFKSHSRRDTLKLETLDPKWIKAVNIVEKERSEIFGGDTTKIYIELKKKKEKQFLENLNN